MFSSPGEDENKEKGDDCVENFFQMSMCMQQNEVRQSRLKSSFKILTFYPVFYYFLYFISD